MLLVCIAVVRARVGSSLALAPYFVCCAAFVCCCRAFAESVAPWLLFSLFGVFYRLYLLMLCVCGAFGSLALRLVTVFATNRLICQRDDRR